MSCEICGKGSCTSSFHSIEDQESFDNVADKVKDRLKEQISSKLNRLNYAYIDGTVWIKLDEADAAIEECS